MMSELKNNQSSASRPPARTTSDNPRRRRNRPAAAQARRLAGGALALLCSIVLATALFLTPDPAGVGTHRQLGLSECGFLERTGYPCPTCGMTTAFALTVRGHILRAFAVQPAGALGALLCVLGGLAGAYLALGGRALDKLLFWINFHWFRLILVIIGIVLASWGWLCLKIWLEQNR